VNPHSLLDALFARHRYARLDASNLEAFVRRPGEALLFFAADPERLRETLDLAVILPELVNSRGGPLRVGVLETPFAEQRAPAYRLRRFPALVFLRAGVFLGAIEGLRDWSDYRRLVQDLLAVPV